jgi:putative ABC transport system permease protein
MVSLRMRKVLRDLWSNKSRTFLVVLSIAIGVFALSLTVRTQALLSENMLASYAAIDPAEITITSDPFDQQLVKAIGRMRGVRAATGINQFQVRVRIGPEWRQLILTAVDDFTNMPINRLTPEGGDWPPPKRTLALERSYLDAIGGRIGATLTIEAPDGRQYKMPVSGLAHDLTAVSGRLGSDILFGYISLDTLEWLSQPRAFNQLQIAVDGDPFDAAAVRRVADQARSRIEDEHLTVVSTRIREPDKPELYNIIASILQTLAALGVLSLLLSTFLVMNTIAGLLARQVPQIGVLKAIGAPAREIVGMYLTAVLILGLLALGIALPLGVLSARVLTVQLAQLLNYDIQSFSVPAYVVALELVAGLIVPLLAALYPIFAGTRVTVRQAISGQGGDQFGVSALDQLSGRIRGIPAALLYAFRNMLRRKGRLALTLAALTLGGAIVIAVLSVRASLFATLDQVANYWRQDITATFDQPYSTAEIADDVRRVAGVSSFDDQIVLLGARERPDGSESDEPGAVFGVAPTTDMLRPTLVRGRWLTSTDTDALVANVDFIKHEPDVAIGDLVTLNIAGRKTKWRVVGVVTTQMVGLGAPKPGQPMVYASYASLAAAQHQEGTANRVAIATTQHDAAFQAQVAQALEAQFARRNVRAVIQTHASVRALIAGLFSTLVLLLLIMAVLFIVVGGVGLTGAMSLSVLERTKEIGVLRAIGASSSSILRIVLAEGICIGVVSWLLAALIAIPLSQALGAIIGASMLSWPLAFLFPPDAVLIWLAAVIALAALASYLPARGAARLSVRDVLAFE